MENYTKAQVFLSIYLDLNNKGLLRSELLYKYSLSERTLRRYLSELRGMGYKIKKEKVKKTETTNSGISVGFVDELIEIINGGDEND